MASFNTVMGQMIKGPARGQYYLSDASKIKLVVAWKLTLTVYQ